MSEIYPATNLHKFIVFFQGPMKMQCQRIYWFVCEVFFEFCQTFAILWIEKPPRGEDWLKRYVSSSNKIVTIITFPVVHCCYIPQGETWISSYSNQGSSWWFFWQWEDHFEKTLFTDQRLAEQGMSSGWETILLSTRTIQKPRGKDTKSQGEKDKSTGKQIQTQKKTNTKTQETDTKAQENNAKTEENRKKGKQIQKHEKTDTKHRKKIQKHGKTDTKHW